MTDRIESPISDRQVVGLRFVVRRSRQLGILVHDSTTLQLSRRETTVISVNREAWMSIRVSEQEWLPISQETARQAVEEALLRVIEKTEDRTLTERAPRKKTLVRDEYANWKDSDFAMLDKPDENDFPGSDARCQRCELIPDIETGECGCGPS